MKNNNLIIYISTGINIIAIAVIVFLLLRPGQKRVAIENIMMQQDSIIRAYINEENQKVFELTAKQFDKGLSKVLKRQDERFAELDDRLQLNNATIKDVISSVEFEASFKGEGKLETKIEYDTIQITASDTVVVPIPSYYFKDKYLNFAVQDNFDAQYTFSPGPVYVDVLDKSRLWGPPKVFSQLSFESPSVQLNSNKVFVRSHPQTWLVIGPSISYGAIISNGVVSHGPSAGISATIPIIKFKRQRKYEFPQILSDN